jgi:hypothetical protein
MLVRMTVSVVTGPAGTVRPYGCITGVTRKLMGGRT